MVYGLIMWRSKLKSLDSLSKICKNLHRQGKKIVFTNGCFDILHLGHIDYLERARGLGDHLIVAINTDRSVRRLKGKGRPVNNEKDRAGVLSGLASVDNVVLFDEDTPLKVIEAIKPDVLVKGGDWKIPHIVGAGFVRSQGGSVKSLKFLKGRSTTSLLKRIKK
jgi:D-beta-D-heptose 7-phosphate kinase/D-beta-D-heptose 1-phosphate adenosyltransferase